MFSVHTTPEEFKNATITGYFGLVFEENLVKETNHYRDVIVSETVRFENVFGPHKNEKPAFSNSLKTVFEKLRFRDGLMWTVGLTVEIKLRFQFSSA
jgi:hypothetical protein